MLSDEWIQETAQEPVPNVGDRVILHLDGSREIISPDGSRKIVHLDEYRDTSEFNRVDAPTGAQDSAQVRSFLGSGWRENLDLPDERRHRGKRKSRLLLAAVGGIVIVGLASGWMMSSTGTTPGTSCASGAQCTTAEHPEQPSESPASLPAETTDPSVEPTVTVKPTTVPRVRESRTSDPRPTVTRSSTPPPKPSPTRQREESSSLNLDPEPETPTRPAPSSTQPAKTAKPSESAPPAESSTPTQEPTSAGNPSPSDPPKKGGLLDWLF
ncbi:hypothetical protein [Streptosporangium subroseum]|nr:hypothetical protein [Streptosporangium subroseum]